MKLTYRGLNYDCNESASVEMNGAALTGKYRGHDVTFRSVKKSPVQEQTHELTYRGIHFNG